MDSVCRDFEQSPLSSQDKALFRYLAKVNDAPPGVSQDDVDQAKAAGWSDDALLLAMTISSMFNFFNRWVDGAGVPDVPEGFYESVLKQRGDLSYSM